jgi:FkbM family methyltransferase
MERIIHFTLPQRLTPLQIRCIDRARALHPTWKIEVWQDPVRPDGHLLEKYWPKANSGAQFSDLLRIDILYQWGGVYVDGDMLLLKPLDDLIDRFEFFVASETGNSLEGALIGARKGHPAIKSLIDELLLNEPDWSLSPDITTGPDLLARTLRWDRRVTVLPRETFYCYPAGAPFRKTHRCSYGEHLWEYSWKHLNRAVSTAPASRPAAARLKSLIRRTVRPPLIGSLRFLRRIESLDRVQARQTKFYAACGEIVVEMAPGLRIVVDGSDTSLTPDVVFGECYEQRDEKFCKHVLRGGDWIIDIGSKCGVFSLLAARSVGSFGRVFSYEPNPGLAKLLSKSAVMNRLHDRVVIRNAAAGESIGSSSISFVSGRVGDALRGCDDTINTIVEETVKMIGGADSNAIDVPSCTLEQEFPIDLPIKLLRIDAQGQEVSVLKGARRLLERRCIDFIVIKIFKDATETQWRNRVARSRWSELLAQLNLLTESSYIACTIGSDGSLVEQQSVIAALEKLQGCNVVLMARDQFIVS